MQQASPTHRIRSIAWDLVMLLGLTALWVSLRYQSFLLGVYPPELDVAVGGVRLSAVSVCRVLTALLAVVLLVYEKPLGRWIDGRPRICAAAVSGGTVAIGIALLIQQDTLGPAWLWISFVLLNLSFLCAYLAWAVLLAGRFGARTVLLMGLSMPLSLLGPQLPVESWGGALYCLAVPVALALPLALRRRDQTGRESPEAAAESGEVVVRYPANPLVWCLCLFLLLGSFVRGFVDLNGGIASPAGLGIALAIGVGLACACGVFWLRHRHSGPDDLPETSVNRLALLCWAALASLFIVGMVLFLAFKDYALGGDVVVTTRSCLQILLWIALCDYVHRYRVPSAPLFMVCVVLVEVASWLLSYVVVPLVFAQGSETDVYTLVTTSVLLLLGCALMFFVVKGSWSSWTTSGPAAGHSGEEGAAGAGEGLEASGSFAMQRSLEDSFGLTPREAQLAVEYADGYSLKKVAEHLGIKQSTAQGYIRKAYRKLGVTTKDQLVDLVRELPRG